MTYYSDKTHFSNEVGFLLPVQNQKTHHLLSNRSQSRSNFTQQTFATFNNVHLNNTKQRSQPKIQQKLQFAAFDHVFYGKIGKILKLAE
jgi:hypothetical protein